MFTDMQGKPSSLNSDVTTTLALTQPQNRQPRRIARPSNLWTLSEPCGPDQVIHSKGYREQSKRWERRRFQESSDGPC